MTRSIPPAGLAARALRHWLLAACAVVAALGSAVPAWAQDVPSLFTNRGTVGNTRHNLTQRQPGGGGPEGAFMDRTRNDYNEVCVYCHTPHGSNRTTTAPLWNRTMVPTTYQTYDLLGSTSITQQISQPGAASLTCLSCHDGQTAVDSIINMPGAGRYNPAQETAQNNAFLDSCYAGGIRYFIVGCQDPPVARRQCEAILSHGGFTIRGTYAFPGWRLSSSYDAIVAPKIRAAIDVAGEFGAPAVALDCEDAASIDDPAVIYPVQRIAQLSREVREVAEAGGESFNRAAYDKESAKARK